MMKAYRCDNCNKLLSETRRDNFVSTLECMGLEVADYEAWCNIQCMMKDIEKTAVMLAEADEKEGE